MAKVAEIIIRAKDEATAVLKRVERSVTDVTASFGKMQSSVDTVSGAMGALKAAGAAMAAREVFGWLKTSVELFAKSERAATLLRNTMRLVGKDYDQFGRQIEEFAARRQNTTIFEGDETKLALAELVRITGTYNKATLESLKLAQDMAAATGGDQVNAARILGIALAGNVQILVRSYVPSLRTVDAEQLKMMGSAERAAIVLEHVGRAFSGAAESSGDATIAMARLDNSYEDLRESIGRLVATMGGLKAIDEATDHMNLLQKVLEFNTDSIGAWLEVAVKAGLGLQSSTVFLIPYADGLAVITNKALGAAEAIEAVDRAANKVRVDAGVWGKTFPRGVSDAAELAEILGEGTSWREDQSKKGRAKTARGRAKEPTRFEFEPLAVTARSTAELDALTEGLPTQEQAAVTREINDLLNAQARSADLATAHLKAYADALADATARSEEMREASNKYLTVMEAGANLAVTAGEMWATSESGKAQAVKAGLILQSAFKAAYEFAEGWAMTAVPGMQWSAAAHFMAAAQYAIVAGGQVAGGGGGGGRGGGSGRGSNPGDMNGMNSDERREWMGQNRVGGGDRKTGPAFGARSALTSGFGQGGQVTEVWNISVQGAYIHDRRAMGRYVDGVQREAAAAGMASASSRRNG